jgi:hypothetical protein
MASRQEQKEARRQARLEAEQREAKEAARAKRVQLVLGGVLALVIVVGAVVLVLNAGGGDKGGDGRAPADQADLPTLPKQAIGDERQAAKAASCTLASPAIEGRGHENKTFTEADYKTNPPTSGAHFPQWAQDGVYGPDNAPQLGELVHTLEHGRIDVQYKPGTPKSVVDQLEAFVAENDGYHMVMFQNATKMTPQVAATAWGHSLSCDTVNAKTWDALRTFRDAHVDQGPEKIP